MADDNEEVTVPLQFTLRDAISPHDALRVTFIDRSCGVEIQPIAGRYDRGPAYVLDEEAARDLHMMLSLWLKPEEE